MKIRENESECDFLQISEHLGGRVQFAHVRADDGSDIFPVHRGVSAPDGDVCDLIYRSALTRVLV